ncbi:MAG: type II toxin-antitoxin system PemK/MazF family toxin [Alphaproteobacteria bacterium]|nr:type II toxin-antitoxin system PemK/MazF family toxin [Alphaproteobacteria bacterium]
MAMVKRFDVYMCDQNGVQKPCLIVSPDEMNEVLPYVMIAPITTASYQFPTRVIIGLKGKKGQIALDMITTIDKTELIRKIGILPVASHPEILGILGKIFS